MIVCKNCSATYCACQGIRCPECGSRPPRDPNSATNLANLPFIAMHRGQPTVLVPVDDTDL